MKRLDIKKKVSLVMDVLSGTIKLDDAIDRSRISVATYFRWRKILDENGLLDEKKIRDWLDSNKRESICNDISNMIMKKRNILSDHEKLDIVRRFHSGVQSKKDFSSSNNIKPHQINMWRNQLLSNGILCEKDIDRWDMEAKNKLDETELSRRFRAIKNKVRKRHSREEQFQLSKEYLSGSMSLKDFLEKHDLDSRKLFRMIKDHKTRGLITESMIKEWQSESIKKANDVSDLDKATITRIKKKKRLSKERKESIVVECLTSGKQIKEIAFENGVSLATISKLCSNLKDSRPVLDRIDLLIKSGVEIKKKRSPKDMSDEERIKIIRELQERSQPSKEIAKKYGVSVSTMLSWSRKFQKNHDRVGGE